MTRLTNHAARLLVAMSEDARLQEIRGRWSTWYLDRMTTRVRVFKSTVDALVGAGFITRTDENLGDAGFGSHYEAFNYTVTDAGRAFVAAINAPQESN